MYFSNDLGPGTMPLARKSIKRPNRSKVNIVAPQLTFYEVKGRNFDPGELSGSHIYICLWSKKIFESYFRDRLTFSNVDSRTSR